MDQQDFPRFPSTALSLRSDNLEPLSSLRSLRRLVLALLALALAPMLASMAMAADPLPEAQLEPPERSLLGQRVSLSLTFDNAAPEPGADGYGPFVDLLLPVGGTDGAAGVDTPDGLDFLSLSYLGAGLPVQSFQFPDDGGGRGCVQHPLAKDASQMPLEVCGIAGDRLVVARLPFGSFVPDQPVMAMDLELSISPLADAGVPLVIHTRAGFQFGADPLDNPCCDPVILSHADEDGQTWPGTEVLPTVLSLRKIYLGPEDETATGPNFPRQYRLQIDIADGQTVRNLELEDLLPPTMAYLGLDSITPAAITLEEPLLGQAAAAPDNRLAVRFPEVTGGPGEEDAVLLFSFFVPRLSADGGDLLDPLTGNDRSMDNQASALGDWEPLDPRDDAVPDNVGADGLGPEHVLVAKSIAIQKEVVLAEDLLAAGPTPGDGAEYTLHFQISDFFAMDGLEIRDVLPDGLRFDPAFSPTLELLEHGQGSSGAMDGANVILVPDFTPASPAPNDGTTTMVFQVSAELASRRGDGRLLGGCVPSGGSGGPDPDCDLADAGPTRGTVRYRARIQEDFSDDFPSGDPSVDAGDVLVNVVTANGLLLSVPDLAANGEREADTSSANLRMAFGGLSKTLHAVNGSTQLPDPLEVLPGDELTFRLRYVLPVSDFEDLVISDYLPLPVLVASEVTTLVDQADASLPAPGQAKLGPEDTLRALSGLPPSLSVDTVANRIDFQYGDYDHPSSQEVVIDLLFTVTVSNQPFADGLLLTNQGHLEQGSTNGETLQLDAIVQFRLRQPQLRVSKGVLSSSNPAAALDPPTAGPAALLPPGGMGVLAPPLTSEDLADSPIDSDVAGLDAGDLVRFAIALENEGGSGAYDLVVRDVLPPGLGVPAEGLNLAVTRGDGLTVTPLFLGPNGTPSDLFSSGIELPDPVGEPLCQKADSEPGANLVLVTYQLEVLQPQAIPGTIQANFGTLTQYGGDEGSGATANHVGEPEGRGDEARVTLVEPEIGKEIVATSEVHTAEGDPNRPVAVGERVAYRISVRVPEGTSPEATLRDQLDPGLELLSLDSITASPGLGTTATGGFDGALAAATTTGSVFQIDFGTLSNSDTDDAVDELLVVEYTVRVANLPAVVHGNSVGNIARWLWSQGEVSAEAPPVLVVEPLLDLDKEVSPAGADAGDTLNYTLTVSNAAGRVTAFDLLLEDLLEDPDLSLVEGSVTANVGLVSSGNGAGDSEVRVALESLGAGESLVVTFDALVADGVLSGHVLENRATLVADSLPADSDAGERTYGPLEAEAMVAVDVPSLAKTVLSTSEPHTGSPFFGPNRVDLTPGEEVVFEIVATIPEGVTALVLLRDSLPASGSGVLEALSAEVITVGSGLQAAAANPVPVLSDEKLSDGRMDTVSFDFGPVTNPPDMVVDDRDSITVRIRARVVDVPSNASGDRLRNTALVDFSGALQPTASARVDLVEPFLVVDKSGDQSSGDAGDVVTFTLAISHRSDSTADAFDLELKDLLPAGLAYVDGSLETYDGLAPTSLIESDGEIVASWDEFPLGSTAELTFRAEVLPDVNPGQVIDNRADLSWDSLPADGGAEERTGGASDTHRFLVSEPGVVKSVVATSEPSTEAAVSGPEPDLTLGEEVTYVLEVTLPEGTTVGAQVSDQLPSGDGVLELVSSRLLTIGDNLSGDDLPALESAGQAEDTDDDGLGDRVFWLLGDVLNAADGVEDDRDRLRFEVVARVADVIANQGGVDDDLSNVGLLTHTGGSALGTALVDLVEPLLSLLKSGDEEFADAGDRVRFHLDLAHTSASNADAFTLNITDQLDPKMLWGGDDSFETSCMGASMDASQAPLILFSLPALTLAEGSCRISYEVVLADTVQPGETLTNVADLLYDSQPVFLAGATRRREAMADAEITILAPALVKIAEETSLDLTGQAFHRPLDFDLAIGELVDYRLTLIFPEGQTPEAVVVDRLPAGPAGVIEAVAASILSLGERLTTTLPGTAVLSDESLGDGLADTVRLSLGTVSNAPDGISDEKDRMEIRITGRVVDLPANLDGRVLTNQASLEFASGPPLQDTADVDVVEPRLELGKSMQPPVDRVVRVSLELSNMGTAPAFDLAVEDSLPASLWDTDSVEIESVPAGFVARVDGVPGGDVRVLLESDPAATSPAGSLAPGESVTLIFRLPLAEAALPRDTVDNTATTTSETTLPGSVEGEREMPPRQAEAVLALPNLGLAKQAALGTDADASGTISPGDTLLYTLTLGNQGEGEASGLVVRDTPDARTTLLAGSITSEPSGAVTLTPEGGFEIALPALAAGAQAVVRYEVRIDSVIPAGVETLVNQASFTLAELPGSVSDDPGTGSPLDPTVVPLAAAPGLTLNKEDGGVTVPIGGSVAYTLTYANIGNQDATGVVLVETVPSGALFDAAASLPAVWSCADGSPAGSECLLPVGNLAVGSQGSATFGLVAKSFASGDELLNLARIRDDGAGSGGVPVQAEASESTPVEQVRFEKERLGSAGVVVGEAVRYRLTIEIPEGASGDAVTLLDLPEDPLFRALAQESISVSPGVSFTGEGQPEVSGNGFLWQLGRVANTDDDPQTLETLEVIYSAQLRNVDAAQRGAQATNLARLNFAGAELEDSATVGVVEPDLLVEKDFTAVVAGPDEVVRVRIQVQHSGDSDVAAHDLEIFDRLDDDLVWVGDVQAAFGQLPVVDLSALPEVRFTVDTLALGGRLDFSFAVRTAADLSLGGRIDNQALLGWTSRAGDPGLAFAEDPASGERTGDPADPGGAVNDYRVQDIAQLNSRIFYAFEDLRNDANLANDFDYNDWLISVDLQETVDAEGNWTHVELWAEAHSRGAGFVHKPFLDIGIEGQTRVNIEYYNRQGDFLFNVFSVRDGEAIRDLSLFFDTWFALPAWNGGNFPFAANTDPQQLAGQRIAGARTRVTIQILEPERNPRIFDDPQTLHLDETVNHLLGPWIDVQDTGEKIYQRWRLGSATQDLVTAELYGSSNPLLGFPLDQARAFPSAWEWPVERVPIWDAFEDFVSFTFSGSTSFLDWFRNPVVGQVWPVDLMRTPASPGRALEGMGLPTDSWASDHLYGSPVSASPAIGDLDGDGTVEVVGAEFLGDLVIHRADGSTQLVIDAAPTGILQSSSSPSLADLDGDRDLEILRGYDDGVLRAWHHDGSTAGSWEVPGTLKSTALVSDLDRDEELEIYLLAGDTQVHAFSLDGDRLAGFPVAIGGAPDISNNFVILPTPAAVDLVGDADLELLVAGNSGVIHLLDRGGQAMPGWPVDLESSMLSSPAAGDLDGQGGKGVAVADDDGTVTLLGPDGSLLCAVQRVLGGPSSPALGDLDGDGDLEVVVGSLDGKIYAWHHDCSTVSGWPVTTSSAVQSSPAVADIDGDGAAEVFVGSFDVHLHGFRGDGTALATSDGGSFPVQLGAIVFSSPAIGDLDGDGDPEVVVGSHDRRLYAIEAAGNLSAGTIPWSRFRGGPNHVGAAEPMTPGQPMADLSITKDNGEEELTPGQKVTYTIVVANAGPADVEDAGVMDLFPEQVQGVAWTCSGSGGGICSAAGAGSIDDLAALPAGASVTYLASGTVGADASGILSNTATVTAPPEIEELDDSNNSATDSDPVAALDVEPPTVVEVVGLEPCISLSSGPASLEILFSESLSDPGPVTEMGNYRLLATGPDLDLATLTCASLEEDDLALGFESIAYDPSSGLATLTLAGEEPLGDGYQRLLVCPSLADPAGNALDGDGDGSPGDEFRLDFRVDTGNLMANGHLDCDLGGWDPLSVLPEEVAHAELDADDASISGSASLMDLAGSSELGLAQCVGVEPSGAFDLGLRVLADIPNGATFELSLGCSYHAEGGCAGDALEVQESFWPVADTQGSWLSHSRQLRAPAEALSAACSFRLSGVPEGEVFFDQLHLRSVAEIFGDGFESGDLSAWASSSGE